VKAALNKRVTDAVSYQMTFTRLQLSGFIGEATVASRCTMMNYSEMFVAIAAGVRSRDVGARRAHGRGSLGDGRLSCPEKPLYPYLNLPGRLFLSVRAIGNGPSHQKVRDRNLKKQKLDFKLGAYVFVIASRGAHIRRFGFAKKKKTEI
jgi:hypothetical protein